MLGHVSRAAEGIAVASEVQWYEPDEALRHIGARLETVGLEIRRHHRCDELSELVITNSADLERGSMSVNRDGFVTWEYTAKISDDKSICEIVDVMTVLLAAAGQTKQEALSSSCRRLFVKNGE
jgi:hypothetical protein